ncbi:EH signature domain-containing protein [Fusobacterium animalis]|uniref:EH signature domain-containing protein n=1 Tax=Fusobacterium animalis TaxID=76859 RepID=UPI0030CE0AA2
MNEINFKKFYPVNLEKKKDEINNFWNQIFKVVRDEKIFELIERVLKKKNLKVDEIIILLFNIKKVHDYLIHKNVELADFIMNIKFDLSEKKVKRKECIMDIYQAIVSYFNENDVELALNLFVDENINFEKEDEREIIQVYQEYSKSKKDYTLFLYDETVKAIKNNKLKDTLDRLFISEEREVFLDIMNKVLFDIVYFVKLEKDYINKILADFFDRVTHEVRIESFKKVLNYYVEEYEKTDDISVCSRAIMEKIHEYLKDPHKNSPKWQWGDFSEAQIEIMRIWLVSADLEKYFSIEVNDKVRLQFWRRYIKYIKEVRYFERLKQAIVMLTDEHIFIEFGEKGNAAYCYKKDYISFSEINNLSTNFRLKNRASAEFFMSHSGNWEVKLKSTLYRLGYSVKVWR